MSKEYGYIKKHEKEMLKLKAEGFTRREIGERFGLTREQVHDFFKRYNRRQREIANGCFPKRKDRPLNKSGELPASITKLDEVSQMRHVIASKDKYIKQLEMELELMRDFLSLTERK